MTEGIPPWVVLPFLNVILIGTVVLAFLVITTGYTHVATPGAITLMVGLVGAPVTLSLLHRQLKKP